MLDMSNKSRFKEGNYDEKIFDEKIYEDIFHQMVSDPTPQQSSSTSKSSGKVSYLILKQIL